MLSINDSHIDIRIFIPLFRFSYFIKNIILNQRKVEIVNKMRTNLMQKAEADKEIEIYKK